MDHDDSEEWEEQELLVYLDFNSKIDDDIIDMEKEFKIIGLDSDNPILQVSNQVYSGEWKDSLGTQVILEEDKNPPRSDPLFSEVPQTYLKYMCKTDKVLSMSRIFVSSKTEAGNKNEQSPSEPASSV